ncbi:cytochrome P450 [Xylogone sp. PMI_703]|nr:cytochrome P450 [Xylogone sp. PMI_703]
MADAIEDHVRAKSDSDRVVQMHDWTTRATLDIIGVAGMGFDFRSLQEPENRIHQEYKRITSNSRQPTLLLGIARSLGLETIFQIGLKMPSKAKRMRAAAMQVVRGVATEVVHAHTTNKGRADELSRDIVSVAVQSGAFSEEGLVDETMTFLGAGHESTSAGFLWAVYALCKYQNIQQQLREEIHANLDMTDPFAGTSTTDKIDHLPYLNAFCNELLRFYPSVPVTLRRTVCDTTVDGLFVPAETMIALPIRAINHDMRHWGPDADEFNPGRWLKPGMSNSGGASGNYANMTFLHGPRSCIGTAFARSELLFLLAALVGRFHMELENPDKEVDCVLQITILPKDGLRVRMTPIAMPVKEYKN